jgi:hypothetical protein
VCVFITLWLYCCFISRSSHQSLCFCVCIYNLPVVLLFKIHTQKHRARWNDLDIKQQYNQKVINTYTKTQRLMKRSGYKTTVQPEGYIDTHKNTEIDDTIWKKNNSTTSRSFHRALCFCVCLYKPLVVLLFYIEIVSSISVFLCVCI